MQDVTVLDQVTGELVRSIPSPIDGLPGETAGVGGKPVKPGRPARPRKPSPPRSS